LKEPVIKVQILATPDDHYYFVVDCETESGTISIQSEKQYADIIEAERDSRESLSEFTTEMKLSGRIPYSYH